MPDRHLVDPLGRKAVLTDRTWDRHILVNHPDMDGGREFVEQAIEAPNSIWFGGKDPDVRIYYGDGPSRGLLAAVKVNITKGVVLTAHLARRESGANREWP